MELKYSIFTTLVFLYFLVELIIGIVFKSVALQTDSFHMLSDLFALLIGMTSIKLSKQKRSEDYTYGLIRAETIGSLINSTFLISICFMLILESIQKIVEIDNNDSVVLKGGIDTVLITAGIGMGINVAGALMFGHGVSIEIESHSHSSHSVFLHILGDLLGSIIVIISGITIKFNDNPWVFYLDPIASILISIFISFSSLKLLKKVINILIHAVPVGLNVDSILSQILKIKGVKKVEEFHLWSLTPEIIIATAHLETENKNKNTLLAVKKVLHSNGIHSSSIQLGLETCCENCEFRCCN